MPPDHPQLAIFLDLGGVMIDNDQMAPQWRRLVGEFLSPRLGGSQAAWAEANSVVFERTWQRYLDVQDAAADGLFDYWAFWEPEHERWLREMCEHVGVEAPDGDACRRLAEETNAYVIARIRAAFPDAADAIRELHARGHALQTASGGSSRDLDGYLEGMGVRALFPSRLYGPDLVGTVKGSPLFYERIFADAGVDPGSALVVDDTPDMVTRAAQAGATAVLVSDDHAGEAASVISSLAELPAFLRSRRR